MIRKSVLWLVSVTVTVLLLSVPQGMAMTASGGVSSFFSWWSPSFEDLVRGRLPKNSVGSGISSSFKMAPSFLVGPSLSVSLPAGFSISSVFLWTSWFQAEGSYYLVPDGSSMQYITQNLDIKKWDLDMLVNYAVNQYLKLFLGIKYQGYSVKQDLVNTTILPSFTVTPVPTSAYVSALGPGFGASLTIDLWGPLYLLLNASMLYLSTNFRADSILLYRMIQVYQTVGFNGTAALAWLIEPASVTISLGFRYQYLHYSLLQSRTGDYFVNMGAPQPIQPMFRMINDDHFYGITLAAIYSLSL